MYSIYWCLSMSWGIESWGDGIDFSYKPLRKNWISLARGLLDTRILKHARIILQACILGVPADYILRFGYAARKWIIDTNQIPSWLVKGRICGSPLRYRYAKPPTFFGSFLGNGSKPSQLEGMNNEEHPITPQLVWGRNPAHGLNLLVLGPPDPSTCTRISSMARIYRLRLHHPIPSNPQIFAIPSPWL